MLIEWLLVSNISCRDTPTLFAWCSVSQCLHAALCLSLSSGPVGDVNMNHQKQRKDKLAYLQKEKRSQSPIFSRFTCIYKLVLECKSSYKVTCFPAGVSMTEPGEHLQVFMQQKLQHAVEQPGVSQAA